MQRRIGAVAIAGILGVGASVGGYSALKSPEEVKSISREAFDASTGRTETGVEEFQIFHDARIRSEPYVTDIRNESSNILAKVDAGDDYEVSFTPNTDLASVKTYDRNPSVVGDHWTGVAAQDFPPHLQEKYNLHKDKDGIVWISSAGIRAEDKDGRDMAGY